LEKFRGLLAVVGAALSVCSDVEPSSAPRGPPDVIVHSYTSRMVYVILAEAYNDAIDVAKGSSLEPKDVECERISLKVKVLKMWETRKAVIGWTAWPTSLVQFLFS